MPGELGMTPLSLVSWPRERHEDAVVHGLGILAGAQRWPGSMPHPGPTASVLD